MRQCDISRGDMGRGTPARCRVASPGEAAGGIRWAGLAADAASLRGGFAPARSAPPQGIWGQMKGQPGLPPLCRPAGWVALWRRLAMMGARQVRVAG